MVLASPNERAGVGRGELDFADGGEEFVVQLRVVDELAERALGVFDLGGDVLKVGDRLGKLGAVVGDDLVDLAEHRRGALAAAERLAHAVGDRLELGAERAELGDDLVHVDGGLGLDLVAVLQDRAGVAEAHREVLAAEEAGGFDGRDRVGGNVDLRIDPEDGLDALVAEAGLGDRADLDAGHENVVARLEALQIREGRDERVAVLLEKLASAEGLKRDPGERDAEQEEEADADGLLAVIHGSSPVALNGDS
ncbi:MAG: hypothetical protein WDM96_17660 [Lacunisphaera sp.]